MLTIKSALISLQGLLASPEPKDPQDAEVAGMLLKNKAEFEHVAHQWAIQYAAATPKDHSEGSGGTTADDLKRRAKDDKTKAQQEKPDAYVILWLLATVLHAYDRLPDTTDTTPP